MPAIRKLEQASPATRGGDVDRLRLIHLRFSDNRHLTAMTDVYAKLCARALDRGWSFEMISPESTRDSPWTKLLTEQGARIHHLPDGSRREITDGILDVLGEHQAPALLHTHFTGYDIAAARAARRREDASVFWHVHSFLASGWKANLRLRLKCRLFRGPVDRIVVPSENIRDSLRRAGVPADRIVMSSSGIEPNRYPLRTHEQRELQRRAMGVPDSAKLLLHFGWNYHVKGTDRFLEAVRLLVDTGTEVIALVNGGGADTRENAERLGLQDVVRLGPLVEETWPLYAASDCMVAPSRGEGMPFSVVEALATGLPVVASELPGHRYLGDNIASCTVVDPEPDKLAAAIATTLNQPVEQADREAAEGRTWIVEHLNTDTVVDSLIDAYVEALAERDLAV